MSTSLLLALLETHEPNESDRSGEYYRWVGEDPARRRLIMDHLYDVLRSTTDMGMRESGALGTVLARTLTDDTTKEGFAEAAKFLRAALRYELFKRFDALKEHRTPSPYPSVGSMSSEHERQLREEYQRLQAELDTLKKTLGILASESK